MVSRKRLYERFRGYYKAFKQNWDLFRASKIGLVGLGILIFFLVIALITPALGLRDPINWRAPEEDLIKVDQYWWVDTNTSITTLCDAGDPINQSVAFRLIPKALDPRTDRIYFASGDKVIALRPSTGERVWYIGTPTDRIRCFQADSLVTAGPVVVNYGSVDNPDFADWVLYFGTESGEFYQLKEADNDVVEAAGDRRSPLPTGKDVSRTTLDSKVTSIAVYSDESGRRNAKERVFVGTEEGMVYAFSAIWKDDESWILNATSEEWQRIYPEKRPLPQDKHVMAYSPASNKILFVGGDNGLSTDATALVETWIFNLTSMSWRELDNMSVAPSPRRESAMVYIPSSDSALLYGGRRGNDLLDDMWTFNFSTETWSQVDNATGSPGMRGGHSMAYVSSEDAVYLFGGRLSDIDKTMKLDMGNLTWSIIIFGGNVYVDTGDSNQTKVYDISSGNWSWIDTPTNITPRAWMSMVYDNATNNAILFGGWNESVGRIGQTWKLNLTNDTWEQLDSTSSPSARFSSSMIFTDNSEAFLFGGDDYEPSELWSIDTGRGPILMADLPLMTKNSPRFSPAVYSPGGARDGEFLVFNGGGDLNYIETRDGKEVWTGNEQDYIGSDGTIGVGDDWSTPPIFSQWEGTEVPPLIYFTTSNGFIHAIYPEDGRAYEPWEITPPGEPFPDGKLNGNTSIYGIRVGKTVLDFDGGVLTRPEPFGSFIYVGSDTGTFYTIRRDRIRDLPAGRPRGYYEVPVTPGENFSFNTPPYFHIGFDVILISGYNDNGTADDWTDDKSTIFSLNQDGNVSWKVTLDGRINGALAIWKDEPGGNHLHKSVFAGLTDGTIQVYSSNGEYLAPLPPTWMSAVPSGNTYWLGTDNQGRDLYSQWMWGTRVALTVGLLAAFFSIFIGTVIGLVAGYSGGKVDSVLMRFTDVILVLPGLPLVIILAAVLGAGIWNIILVITIVGWPGTARVIRSEVLSLKERPFIDSARVSGASSLRIMFKHIAPNVLPLAFLYMTFAVSGAILTEAALSFIGLGDVNTPSWGQMLMLIQQSNVLGSWWWLLPPGLGITFLSLAFYLIGRGYEQIVNPRLRQR
jgi:peptide/nickel transport system permease protein